jgi:phosphohistidine phosphatase
MAELLLLRHGIAEERRPDLPDGERPLTARGICRTRAVLQRLVALELCCDQLFSSPLRRARQTAELAVEAGLAPAGEVVAALAPGGEVGPLLQRAQGLKRLALVGHEPDLGDLAARLIGARAGALALKKAGVAVLQCDGPQEPWRLRLLIAPAQLLAGS